MILTIAAISRSTSLFIVLLLATLGGADPISRLTDYLAIRTDHGFLPDGPDYIAAAKFLNETIARLLPTAKVQQWTFVPGKPVTIATLPGSDPSLPSILLNSHTDVVPAQAGSWKHGPPFPEPGAQNNNNNNNAARLYARGSQDMKSIGMQYIEALAGLTQSRWNGKSKKNKRDVHVSFVPDEEIGGFDGMGELIKSQVWPTLNVGLGIDEGSPNPAAGKYHVYVGERQTWWLVVRVKDNPGHGATFPQNTASQTLHAIIGRALKFRAKEKQKLDSGTPIGEVTGINIAFMESGYPDKHHASGYISNMIPAEAKFGFDIRVPPTVKFEDMDAEIESWMQGFEGVTWEFTNKVKIQFMTDLKTDNNDNAWYKNAFFDGLSNAGIAPADLQVSIFEAATDARFIRDTGIPAIGFSPITNTPNLLHKHDEYIDKKGYIAGIEVYKHLIKSLAEADGSPADVKTEL